MSYPNLTQDDIETMAIFFQWMDTDKDGFVTVDEIKDACAVDLNGDGVITEEEKTQCAQAWLGSYLSQQDVDGDARISLHELLKYNNDTKNQSP
jgi:Ca2+-binding EF-hand superfamily protein